MQPSNPVARLHAYYSRKQKIIGRHPPRVPYMWRPQGTVMNRGTREDARAPNVQVNKIFVSALPFDVKEKEVEDLFRKTVGPLRDAFLVYNSAGQSKGMAVIDFQRSGDALVARAKFNGKIVDGCRTLNVELVVDDDLEAPPPPPPSPPAPSLLERLGIASTCQDPDVTFSNTYAPMSLQPRISAAPVSAPTMDRHVLPRERVRQKKLARRLKKARAQLDKEMEEYRSALFSVLSVENCAAMNGVQSRHQHQGGKN